MQESLLLKFRKRQNEKMDSYPDDSYNLLKGVWEDSLGNAIILNSFDHNHVTQSTATIEEN